MRVLVTLALVLLPGAALAQGTLGDMICQAKPTTACVLEMAVEASMAALPGNESLPLARIVETASRSGNLDIALPLLDHVAPTDALAKAELVAGAARAGRIAAIEPFLRSHAESPSSYAFEIAPVLVELGCEAELATFVATMPAPPTPEQVTIWNIQGHLQAGRAEVALEHLAKLPADERSGIAGAIAETLYYKDRAEQARPLLPHLETATYLQLLRIARLAEALRDAGLAAIAEAGLAGLSAEDRSYVSGDVARALAASGSWRKAVELVPAEPVRERAFLLLQIAALARRIEPFREVEKAMVAERDVEVRERMVRLLVRALILSDLEPVAMHNVQLAGAAEQPILLGFAAVALAEMGKASEGVTLGASVEDPLRRAWILWEVASKLKP